MHESEHSPKNRAGSGAQASGLRASSVDAKLPARSPRLFWSCLLLPLLSVDLASGAPGSRLASSAPAALPVVTDVRASSRGLPFEGSDIRSSASQCINQLLAQNVAFVPLRHSRGVSVPVQIGGPIGGVRYRSIAGYELVVDCRFALVLARVGPLLRKQGVSEISFSIAHQYRLTSAGRLSLHANGLALDVHRVLFANGSAYSVGDDFRRKQGQNGCGSGAKPLNQLACALAQSGWFSELLTPDDNAEHRDHFHIAIARTSAWPSLAHDERESSAGVGQSKSAEMAR